MDIGGLPNKLIGGVEKNAALIAFAGAAYLRMAEVGGNTVWRLIDHFTNLGVPSGAQIRAGGGGGGYGALGEVIITLSTPTLLGDKLFNSNHAYTTLFKLSLAGYIAGELGVLPSRYANIAKKVMMGAAAAAIVLPGSNGGNAATGNGYTGSRLIGN